MPLLTRWCAQVVDENRIYCEGWLAKRSGGAKNGEISIVRAAQGRLSALSVFLCKSVLYGAIVWARRALNSQKRRFPARAVVDDAALAALDELEGVAAGRYTRRSVPVELLAGEPNAGSAAVVGGGDSTTWDDNPQTAAWLYCIKDVPELEKRGALLAEYSAEVHASYTPKAGRDETLKRAWGGYEVL